MPVVAKREATCRRHPTSFPVMFARRVRNSPREGHRPRPDSEARSSSQLYCVDAAAKIHGELSYLASRIILRIHIFKPKRPDSRYLRDIFARLRPVEVGGIAGQYNDARSGCKRLVSRKISNVGPVVGR